jgi:L-fuconolactonase
VLNVPVSEVILNEPRIRALVGQSEAASVAQHVRMGEDGRANVYCKISGLVTEADFEARTEAQLQPYLETVLEAFEPNRLMFGSDWPVCLVACNYQRWYDIVCRFAASLSPEERGSLFGRTAARAYNLHVPDV